jgi:hypothetical protein
VFLAPSLFSPAPAVAANYTVFPCASAPGELEFAASLEDLGLFGVDNRCGTSAADVVLEANNTQSVDSLRLASWKYVPPAFATIQEISMDLSFPGWDAPSALTWRAIGVQKSPVTESIFSESSRLPGAEDGATYRAGNQLAPKTVSFRNEIVCLPSSGSTCPRSPRISAVTKNLRVVLNDDSNPTVEASGTLFNGTVEGLRTVDVRGRDGQSGVFVSRVKVDGQPVSELPAPANGGKCRVPFSANVPCLREPAITHTIDTTAFSNAAHTAEMTACDATAVNCATVSRQFTVVNEPRSTTLPVISGTARVDSPLNANTGTWTAPAATPLNFATQWFRCPQGSVGTADCEPIAGATRAAHVPTPADVGKQLRAKVTATLQAAGRGSASVFSAPTAAVAALPSPTGPVGPGGGDAGGGGGGPTANPGRPPQTTLSKHPRKKTAVALTKFAFSADQPGSRFECKLDKKPFKPCTAPFKKTVKRGRHTFGVRAVNSAGMADPTPSRFQWTRLAASKN